MNHKLPIILAVAMALMALSLYLSDRGFGSAEPVEVQEPIPHRDVEVQAPIPHRDEVPDSLQTYIPPRNIYLPKMMFLVVKDTDKPTIARCKNMAYRSVDSFSRRVNSNLVHNDKKLFTLARIIYGECIDVVLATYKNEI